MTPKEAKRKLHAACAHLREWQVDNAGKTEHRCLEAVRHACSAVGIKLPMSDKDYEGKLAITCGQTLARNPAKWGWQLIGRDADAVPTDRPSLLFFEDCGKLDDGRVAGHVAIFKPSTMHIVANTTYNFSKSWAMRVAYVFDLA